MLPNKYASEHFSIPLASAVFEYLKDSVQKSFADATVLSTAVRNVPACEKVLARRRVLLRPSSGSCGAGPSKFAEFRSVICLRTRSPVPGRIKVPFLSFCTELLAMVLAKLDYALDNLHCAWTGGKIGDRKETLDQLKPTESSFWCFHGFVSRHTSVSVDLDDES